MHPLMPFLNLREFYLDLYINMKRVNELPFDSDRKMMTTVHLANGKYRVITKGAPDVLLKRCTKYYDNGNIISFDSSRRLKIEQENNDMAEKALRVIAVAYSELNSLPSKIDSTTIENNLI